jgi:hypothetical protein
MPRKIIGYYSETGSVEASDADQLVVEISRSQVVCLVKGSASQEIEGFECLNWIKSIPTGTISFMPCAPIRDPEQVFPQCTLLL